MVLEKSEKPLQNNLAEQNNKSKESNSTSKGQQVNSSSATPVTFKPIKEKKVDTTLARRYELKYLVSQSTATAIERYVADYLPVDHYSKLQPDGFYPIVSLYMDSPELRLCYESMTGVLNRFKLRIRGYSDDPSYPKFFEIKRRANTVIIKSRSRVKADDVPALISGRNLPPAKNDPKDIEALKMFQLYMFSINAKPAILIRYERKAYEGTAENRVRVTFDKDLCYNVTNEPVVRFSGTGWQKNNVSLAGIILEIKFTGRFPAWLSRMAELFNIRQRSMSKYASSIQNACLLKFCAPKLPIIA
jgi:SPX domain protein involved in polyphosphate accumulation